jgi:hypothetical protein
MRAEPWCSARPRLGAIKVLIHRAVGIHRSSLVEPAVLREPRPTKKRGGDSPHLSLFPFTFHASLLGYDD